ncbi:hypothetical protein MtrunA17_Chr1g0195371 [Medicago truncatula]|uniref:Uncharacterized protein n=1 Tax=Medicago truncatula TaxID=3880 RepID=A0A396JS16_MEDTR|nr:hypothetical protein MtrunA17_Chr1g0195371 [Medicago truncatula]
MSHTRHVFDEKWPRVKNILRRRKRRVFSIQFKFSNSQRITIQTTATLRRFKEIIQRKSRRSNTNREIKIITFPNNFKNIHPEEHHFDTYTPEIAFEGDKECLVGHEKCSVYGTR